MLEELTAESAALFVVETMRNGQISSLDSSMFV